MKIKLLKESELDDVLSRFDSLLTQHPPRRRETQDKVQLKLFTGISESSNQEKPHLDN